MNWCFIDTSCFKNTFKVNDVITFFFIGSKVYKELRDVITSNFLMNDIKKLSPGEQTSDLEAFHSLVCQFVPKSTHYFYDAMKAR